MGNRGGEEVFYLSNPNFSPTSLGKKIANCGNRVPDATYWPQRRVYIQGVPMGDDTILDAAH